LIRIPIAKISLLSEADLPSRLYAYVVPTGITTACASVLSPDAQRVPDATHDDPVAQCGPFREDQLVPRVSK
jgi:hypothetical protein